MPKTPLVLVGDAPGQSTGLSRILTDLTVQILSDPETAGVFDVRTVGWIAYAGLPTHGVSSTTTIEGLSWPSWVYGDFSTRGRQAVSTAYRSWFGSRPGVLCSVWDPARCLPYVDLDLPVSRWGYFAVDAHNRFGTIGGPAADVVRRYDRVLAYGPFGLQALRPHAADPDTTTWLPHGVDLTVFTPLAADRPAPLPDRPGPLIGCVATNQRRKDLRLFAETLMRLRRADPTLSGWLHTDREVAEAWSVPELAASYDLGNALIVTTQLTDADLAACYARCTLTIAPGRGEGFGYPILESLACGVPVLHGDYGGGADLLPVDWRVPVHAWDIEGPYLSRRPIVAADDVVPIARAILGGGDYRAACIERAAAYAWPAIWPAWRAWLLAGVG